MEVEQTIHATVHEDGLRIDRLMCLRFPVLGREDWQDRIRTGQVLLEGRTVRPSAKVKSGSQIVFRYERRPEPEVNRAIEVLWEDHESMVIHKPANLPVHPSGIYFENTLTTILRSMFPDHTPLLVHRLDRETSGLLLLAKTKESASRLQKQFLSSTITKEYLVLVEGQFPESLDAAGFLGPAGSEVKKRMKFARVEFPGSVSSHTGFSLVGQGQIDSGSCISLIRAILHTGRMHQIRATLCSLGFPVVGDRLYGVDETMYLRFVRGEESSTDRELLRMDRTALHSARLIFESGGKTIQVDSNPPQDFVDVMRQFGLSVSKEG